MRYRIGKIGIHILAFMVARCSLLGMYPFVVPFFMAAYLNDLSSISIFTALLFGVLSRFDGLETIRYGVVLIFFLVLLVKTKRERIFSNDIQIPIYLVLYPFDHFIFVDSK